MVLNWLDEVGLAPHLFFGELAFVLLLAGISPVIHQDYLLRLPLPKNGVFRNTSFGAKHKNFILIVVYKKSI